ncbi:MAG: GNAT family N-acetyltransferase, partial [Bacteroidetes bacterium]|nr:GNAT family N-acetyltransferase [Bacteroidota bacterium]
QRTAINSEAKLLMLRQAFDVWGCIRVELKTDVLNQPSRAAIARIGAREEGVFRKHLITERGRVRDTVYYSRADISNNTALTLAELKSSLIEV